MIPAALKKELSSKVDAEVISEKSVSGGSINQAARIELSSGNSCFLKWNRTADPEMFNKEQKGLETLSRAQTDLCIPEVYATGATAEGTGYLVQEYMSEGHLQPHSATDFGRDLAQLHRHSTDRFGLDYDNYIGKLPQSNTKHDQWTDFFIEERMQPQLKMAVDAGKLGTQTANHFNALFKQLKSIFPKAPPSLLHGDLWGGNYFYDEAGRAVLYDPAVYYGHREIELAFTHLFGGFSSEFYQSYTNEWPLDPGFSSRKDIYNLYPLLVHTNLFGGSYGRRVEGIVGRYS